MKEISIKDLYTLGEEFNLEILAQQIVEGFLIGMHTSPFHGFSVEFSEHKLYNQGESIKNIDWKVYARTDKMYTKKYEEETNLRCQIIIDTSSSMYFPSEKENKLIFSSFAAAALIQLLKKQRDAFGLSTFNTKVDFHTTARLSENNRNIIFNQLEKVILSTQRGISSDPSTALHDLAEQIHRRSMVVLFSDMFENTANEAQIDQLFLSLQHLKFNKHEIVIFHTLDKGKEMDFDYESRPHEFIDMETGEKIKVHTNSIKDAYTSRMKVLQAYIQEKCLMHKIDYIKVDIAEGYKKVLQTYLVKRNKMI
jgi:uncharacterized protein (DUF58 family)